MTGRMQSSSVKKNMVDVLPSYLYIYLLPYFQESIPWVKSKRAGIPDPTIMEGRQANLCVVPAVAAEPLPVLTLEIKAIW